MDNTYLVPILIALFACLLVTVVFCLKRRSRGKSVLLVGICDAGKTTLFSNLLSGEIVHSFTSLKENIGRLNINNKFLQLVDIPGHDKLRGEYLQKYGSDALAVIFVVDSNTIQNEVKDVAEVLHNLFVDPVLAKNRVKFLIACNKQDAMAAKGVNIIKHVLEKELNTLVVTRTGALKGLDLSSKSRVLTLTKPGSDFTFSKFRHSVEFVECSASGEITVIRKWLSEL